MVSDVVSLQAVGLLVRRVADVALEPLALVFCPHYVKARVSLEAEVSSVSGCLLRGYWSRGT